MKQITILIIAIYLCLSSQVLGSEKAVIGEGYLIQTSEAAVQRASALSGIDLVAGDGKSQPAYKSELLIYVDTTTPFLSERLNGRTAWRVDIENVSLSDLIDTVEKKGTHPVDVSIMIDAENGKLLFVHISTENKQGVDIVDVPARIAAGQLRLLREEYHGLGEGEPNINFIQALQIDLGVNLSTAKKIVGQYLQYSANGSFIGSTPRPVWVIQVYGMSTNSSQSYRRNIVDANSGKALVGMDFPYLSSDSDRAAWDKYFEK